MKKFVSFGTALMMGQVIAKNKSQKNKSEEDQIQNQVFPERRTHSREVDVQMMRKKMPTVEQIICPEKICSQTRTVPYYNRGTGATYNVLQCYNCETDCTCEWEFANNHEFDGTEDGSYWTSIITDNLIQTSPSPLALALNPEMNEDSVVTSVASSKTSEEQDKVFDLFHKSPKAQQILCPTKTCTQTRTVPYFNQLTGATYNVIQCYNCETDCTCECEWANHYEIDATEDGSYWTSIITDNILQTSPSIDDPIVENDQSPDDDNISIATSVDPSHYEFIEAQNCTKCYHHKEQNQDYCFDGFNFVPKSTCKK